VKVVGWIAEEGVEGEGEKKGEKSYHGKIPKVS
jgi:hypothetical protein